MSYTTFKGLFGPLKSPEAITAYNCWPTTGLLQERGGVATPVVLKGTDDVYWHVFDYDFIAGKPYDKAQFDAAMPVAVITANTARMLFGTTDVVGREVLLNYVPYRVCGVVKDVSRATKNTYAHIFIPFLSNHECNTSWQNDIMGALSVTILARTPDDFDKIRDEYNASMARYNKNIASTKYELLSLGRPYDQEKDAYALFATQEPDMDSIYILHAVIFAILLLVPAINLSSMTESRLRGRMSEIGGLRVYTL